MIFVAHNMMIISRVPKIFIFSGLPLCKKRLIELLHRCMKRSHQKKMRWLFESRHTFKIFVDFDLPQDYEDQIGIGSPQIWMWVSAAVEERIPVEAIVVFYCLRLLLSILTLKLMGQVRSALQWKKINILSLLRYGTRTQKKHWYFLIRSTFLRDLKITPCLLYTSDAADE